jgi:hypothetical protein
MPAPGSSENQLSPGFTMPANTPLFAEAQSSGWINGYVVNEVRARPSAYAARNGHVRRRSV